LKETGDQSWPNQSQVDIKEIKRLLLSTPSLNWINEIQIKNRLIYCNLFLYDRSLKLSSWANQWWDHEAYN